MTIVIFKGLHSQKRHFVALNSSIQQTNYDPCLNVKILTIQDLQTLFFTTCPGMTKLKTLISKTFFLLWIVIYGIKFIQHQTQRHQCHHQARRSLLQEQLVCFLLLGSPGQVPRLHRSGHGGQQGQAYLEFNIL